MLLSVVKFLFKENFGYLLITTPLNQVLRDLAGLHLASLHQSICIFQLENYSKFWNFKNSKEIWKLGGPGTPEVQEK